MRILLTGAFGNVGRSTLAALEAEGDAVTIFEQKPRGRQPGLDPILRAHPTVLADIRDPGAAREAMAGQEAVIHLAALIPPAADRSPALAHSVNVEGTANLLRAAEEEGRGPRFVLASSIAAYGDRLATPWIRVEDGLHPNPDDEYGRTKVEAEALVRASSLPWSILRLSYIVWRKKLARDPLMFHMPPGTCLEVCHTEDAGRAFAAAARRPEAQGETFDIGGGPTCRTTFRAYLDRMFALVGLGSSAFLPDTAFAPKGFHCGYYADSDRAEEVLGFRRKGLEDYYREVAEEVRSLRPWTRLAAPLIRNRLRASSPFGGPA